MDQSRNLKRLILICRLDEFENSSSKNAVATPFSVPTKDGESA
jgi:hypothetical protein